MRLADQIHPEIFERHPDYCWAKVLCWGLDNAGPTAPAERLSRQVEAGIRADSSLAEVAGHLRIAAWRDAFSAFGARPSKFQSSIEALVRRVRRGDQLPAVNLLVGLYNAISLRYLLPIGGDDLAAVSGGLHLRAASGLERYCELGTGASDPPPAGEIVYADDEKVLCRRWCWRQGDESKITTASRAVVLNVHGLPPTPRADVEAAARELADLVPKLCGGESRWYLLDRAQPRVSSDLPID